MTHPQAAKKAQEVMLAMDYRDQDECTEQLARVLLEQRLEETESLRKAAPGDCEWIDFRIDQLRDELGKG